MRNPLKRKKQTPYEMEKWMTYWVDKRSRGMMWFLLESATAFSFFYLFFDWLLLLINLNFHTGPTFPFWQPLVIGLFSGWLAFRENEYKYQRYLSELQQPQYLTGTQLSRF